MSEWHPDGTGDPVADQVFTLTQLEQAAARRLAGSTWNYVESGAGDETALRDATVAWRRNRLLPHSMTDVSHLSTEVTVLGQRLAHPILCAPSATHARYHPLGEAVSLAGAHAAESIFTLSTLGSTTPTALGSLASELGAPWWMQVYFHDDRTLSYRHIDDAVAAGTQALVLTVDTPALGTRDRDRREADGSSEGVHYPTLAHLPHVVDPTPAHRRVWNAHLAHNITPHDITLLRERYDVPIIAKGVLRPDDARRAVDAGAHALIVSNHGARNLDTVVATADALRPVVRAVDGQVPVLVDGGIRRGTDVATALCMGASGVMIGRPLIWGLATYGQAGVQHVIELLRTELEQAMALLGAPHVSDLTGDLLAGQSSPSN